MNQLKNHSKRDPESRASRPALQLPRLLVVENDGDDRELVQMAIEETGLGVHIEFAVDGLAARERLEIIAENGDQGPDLMLLDLNMPRMDGKTLLAWCRRQDPWRRLPVVILTTSPSQRDRADCIALGVQDYIVKPSRFSELCAAVAARVAPLL